LPELRDHCRTVVQRLTANRQEIRHLQHVIERLIALEESPHIQEADALHLWPALQGPEAEALLAMEELVVELTLWSRWVWEELEGYHG
jgi:bacterioferritin (cytochrome b1)